MKTLKHFGMGLLVVVGLPIWVPALAVLLLFSAICGIGERMSGPHEGEA